MNESQKLLVEDDKLLEFELLLPPWSGFSKKTAGLDGSDKQPLLHKAVANLGDRGPVLYVLRDMSALVGGIDQVFRHAVL